MNLFARRTAHFNVGKPMADTSESLIFEAIHSYFVYLGRYFWPLNLPPVDVHNLDIPIGVLTLSCIVLLLISLLCLYWMQKASFLLMGWLWYLGVLFPVIGAINISPSTLANRYTYIPMIGITVMIAWGVKWIVERTNLRRRYVVIASIILLAALMLISGIMARHWKNSLSLFSYAVTVADVIDSLWGPASTLVVVSTDLTHYLSYGEAQKQDRRTCQAIESLDAGAIGGSDACGAAPLRGLLTAASRRGLSARTLDLRNSGDTAGPGGQVVGYGAWMFVEDESCRTAA